MQNTPSPTNDYVVLLHGIARSSRHMQKLANALAVQGYNVLNLDYPSTRYPLESLAEQLAARIAAYTTDPTKKIHYIGYSMGALVVRVLLHKYRPKNLGHVILLAPPNQGSDVADFLQGNRLYHYFYGPAGQQLRTDQTAILPLLGTIDYPCGVIAGDRSIDPVCSWLIIKGKNDGKVSIKHTKVQGMTDHLILHATHTFFPQNLQVIKQAAYFLEYGRFRKPQALPPHIIILSHYKDII